MDDFEQLVSEILWMEGYWVRSSVKVELTKEEKRAINRHSSPRWEIDVVGYKAGENLLRVVECKSYLDSMGVRASAFDGTQDRAGTARCRIQAARAAAFGVRSLPSRPDHPPDPCLREHPQRHRPRGHQGALRIPTIGTSGTRPG